MIKKGIQWLTDRIAQRFGHAARHLTARTGEQVNVTGLMLDVLTQRERQNELPWLTPQRAVELYEAWRRGELADVQRVWEQLEETDDTLGTVLDKRQRALADMPWAILTDAEAIGDDAERARKAELQQAYLQTVFNAVENLEEAFVHLGMADFRGVAALEITGNMQRMRWEVIEPWCLARPVRRGPWLYNAKAEASYSTLEALDAERVIVREARPIDLACMFLIVDKMHAIHGWDAFLDVYGNPSIFLELPPATGEQMARVYDALAKRIIGDGRGTVPNGSKFQTVETRQNNCDSFEKRAKWCQDAIITVATGGLLTITTESGSGTLAGSAHTDSFENLVAGSAASISAAINRQFTRRLLAAAFPDDPPLAYFSLAPEPADERMQLAQLLATLKTAGWQTTQEKASELMQMDVEPVPAAPAAAPMMNTAPDVPAPVVNRTEEPQAEEPPLTDEELAAFAEMRHPNPERMAQHLASVEAKLRGAADLPEDGGEVKNRSLLEELLVTNSGPGGDDCMAKSQETCRCGPADWKPLMMPDPIKPEAAREKLAKGVKVQNPLGEDVTLDKRLLEHWAKEGKDAEDVNRRLSALPLIEEVVKNPAEIWQNENGSRTYLASVVDPYKPKGKSYTVAFTQTADNTVLETYWPDTNSAHSKRKGEQLWPKGQADASDT